MEKRKGGIILQVATLFALGILAQEVEDGANVFRDLLLGWSQFVLILFFHA